MRGESVCVGHYGSTLGVPDESTPERGESVWWVVVVVVVVEKVGQYGSALGVNSQSTTREESSRGESRRVKIRETHMEISATYPQNLHTACFQMTIYIANSENLCGRTF